MSQGRISRSRSRHPEAKRRAARYGAAPIGRRPSGLPPHLLPGVTGRQARKGLPLSRFIIAGAVLSLVTLGIVLVTFVLSTAAAVGGTVQQYKKINGSLPNAASVAVNSFQTTSIYDRNDVLLQQVDQTEGGWRTFVPLTQVSQYLQDATISAEDATFYSNLGVEPIAIIRGVVINFSGSGSSGGSTITQQLARGLYPDQIGKDLSATRKFKEALAAVALDKQFSKQDILTMYLNQIFYGQRSYGIEAAANTYFSKHAKDLTLGEASMLAGLPQAPSFFDPTVRFDQAKKRQQYVLNQMVKYKYVTEKQARDAYNEPLQPQTRNGQIMHAPHFTQYVRQYVEARWPGALYTGGLKITTSVDVALQERAEQIVASHGDDLAVYSRNNAAMVVLQPWSGQILAMVGSMSFDDPYIGGQNNYALVPLQPGSSIKPIVYAAAFESGWNPATVIMDGSFKEPTGNPADPVYEPQNYTGNYYGAVPVRIALNNSLNIPAVKALKFAGGEHVEDLARRMGYTADSLSQHYGWYGDSMALGSGEVRLLDHTNVYATFANNGKFVPANPILKIEDSQGNVVYDVDRDKPWEQAQQGLRAEYAYQISSILTDNDARSMIFSASNIFGDTQQALGRPTAAKSGTTNGWKDIWTMGYTTDLAVGVWVGDTSADGTAPSELPQWDGSQGAGPIWRDMMMEMHQNAQWSPLLLGPNGAEIPKAFPKPPGIIEGDVCVSTGNRAKDGFESRKEVLVAGEGPSLPCDQLSAYQSSELQAELQDLRVNGGRYASGGAGRVERYASGVSNRGDGSFGASPQIEPASGDGG